MRRIKSCKGRRKVRRFSMYMTRQAQPVYIATQPVFEDDDRCVVEYSSYFKNGSYLLNQRVIYVHSSVPVID